MQHDPPCDTSWLRTVSQVSCRGTAWHQNSPRCEGTRWHGLNRDRPYITPELRVPRVGSHSLPWQYGGMLLLVTSDAMFRTVNRRLNLHRACNDIFAAYWKVFSHSKGMPGLMNVAIQFTNLSLALTTSRSHSLTLFG
jgi:hypothetical protein